MTAVMPLLPVLEEAARGHFPPWAAATPKRRAHGERVRAVLEGWAREGDLAEEEVLRWGALGILHDALRDAPHDALAGDLEKGLAGTLPEGGEPSPPAKAFLPPDAPRLPGPLLHGPAAALRLRDEGVRDVAFLRAVAFHTLGHPDFDPAGRALYCADALEPGRPDPEGWRAPLRARFALDPEAVLAQVIRRRMLWQVEGGRHLHPHTVGLWNRAGAVAPPAPGEGARP